VINSFDQKFEIFAILDKLVLSGFSQQVISNLNLVQDIIRMMYDSGIQKKYVLAMLKDLIE